MRVVAPCSLIGIVAGHAIVGPSDAGKENEAKEKEAEGHKKAAKELQRKSDEAKTKVDADRVVTK